ncbi:MAG: lysylphosphatidylglycerol synthase transmembrane domain-containing protein, partial [Octadecabacter sp.]
MTEGKAPNTRMAFRLMQVITTIVVMAVLWRVADGRQTGKILGSAQPIWLIAGLLALTLQTVLSAIRWRITAAQLGLKIPLGVAIREYYLSQLINQVVPGGVVGDASRAVR